MGANMGLFRLLFLLTTVTATVIASAPLQAFHEGAAERLKISRHGPATLTPSGPITVTQSGQVVENVRIRATDGDAITVDGVADVVIRNVEIHHEGGKGISVVNSNGTRIENVNIVHTGAPEAGPNEQHDYYNIYCTGSTDVKISHARVTRGSSGIWAKNCHRLHAKFVVGYDFRGPFPRGQIFQVDHSDDTIFEDFYNRNNHNSWVEDNINIWRSSNATIRRGVLDYNNSPSGVGVIFEHTDDKSSGGVVANVDAINMGNGCFSAARAEDVTFREVRCRENICDDLDGRGTASSNSLMFHSWRGSTGIRFERAEYFASCNDNIAWNRKQMERAEFQEVDFTMRAALQLAFSWEERRDQPTSVPAYDLSVGDRVQNTNPLNVRNSPNGALLGTQSRGTQGTLVDGPIVAGRFTWWKVDFDVDPDGWSAENWLELPSHR